MNEVSATDLARALYAALAAGDRDQLDALLHPEFTGRAAEGMPLARLRGFARENADFEIFLSAK